jgi:hypothetical protein
MFEFATSKVAQELLAKAGSMNRAEAVEAGDKIARALTGPLREALFSGDIITQIFTPLDFSNGMPTEFPLDPIAPGTQKDFVAYTIPNQGTIPQKHVEGDYVMVPWYQVGNSIDWLLRYSKYSRWDVVGRLLKVFRAGFVKKLNDDGWHTLLAAGYDRGVVAFDSDAGSGQFTKRLVSLMKTVMVRGAGGNSATPNRGELTDLYQSKEAVEDIRNWGVDIIDEFTRKDIFDSADGLLRIFGVNLHPMDELGEGQEYQNFYLNALGGAIQANDVELVVGLDMKNNDSFVMPMVSPLEVFNDDGLHRQQRQGLYGWLATGFGVLDSRRIILGSL